ncbi:hypothetical protein KP509_35G042300 [Ceratopteris richardii]|uniref:Uncharacterized protein n=1 Tax=Ceratopteris richardii TaxID=49495 RepID=A0A8T2QEY7_CERRI|nr:hypothetical protein KP509_35G042300 [Ceratopteris richardii]
MSPGRADELRVFFLTCSSLLLGRLVPVELEGILQECGPVLLQALFGLLRSKHEDVLDLAIAILRALLFQSGAFEGTTLKMNIVAPLLMDLLDERDATCKAAVALIADYFAMNPCAPEMEKLFRLLGSENLAQRQNALAVISELLQALSSSDHDMADGIRKLVAVHLLKHLGDTELVNRLEISRLFSKLDPEFVLPALVHNVYSRDEKVRSAASASIIALLKHHSDSCVTLCVLLDSTRNIIHNAQLPSHPGQIAISKNTLSSDVDRVMHLIRNWAREHDWEQKIDVILKKMFLEPSNPVIPRFLSEINTQLLKNIDSVFRNVLCFMIEQKQLLENLSAKGKQGDGSFQESAESFVFEKLSPLLVLKVLPLAAFDKSCREFYGRTVENGGHFDLKDVCIMHFLLDRACGEYEAYEVRKLSSELLGRCNPGIVLPVLETRLKNGIKGRHFLEMKSCLFSLCNLVMLRGTLALQNPCMVSIRLLLFQVLMWPCSPTDADTYNVQYGCIDCLALIIVAELGSSSTEKSSGYQNFGWKFLDKRVIEEVGAETNSSDGNFESVQAAFQQSVLLLVVSCLVDQNHANTFLLGQLQLQNANDGASYADDFTIHASFRICMGNVLIRATQQISTKDRSGFLSYTMPIILDYIQVAKDGHVLSVCLQFLFSVVHNFKDQTLPYAIDFFNLSLRIIRSKASSEERLAATRLLASLMSSTDIVMNEVAPLLPQAVHVLETVSRIDPSSELRILCEKLLECMVSSP